MNKEIVGKNLLDKEPILTGKGLPKIIGITENQYYEYEKLQQENKQLKINCNIGNENLNFYRKENKQLKDNWNELKKWLEEVQQEEFDINGFVGICTEIRIECILNKMQEIEKR